MAETQADKPRFTNKQRMRAKLIFNPSSGTIGESPMQLMDVISEMQAWKFVPEAYLVEPDSDLSAAVQSAIEDGMRMFVVCGGDGTIDIVARTLAGTNATLGIIPTGTQNNVALSLGIPSGDIPAAIAILRNGKRLKVDMGQAEFGNVKRSFLEVCSVGLASALFSSADDIQHGDLTRIGDFMATLVSSSPSEMHLTLDGKKKITAICHAVLISNSPYIGPHFQVRTSTSMIDGLLDVLLFADLSKMELLGAAVQAVRPGGGLEDERIQHFHVRSVDINTQPAMLVMADGDAFGEGPVHIEVRPRILAVMAGEVPARGATQS